MIRVTGDRLELAPSQPRRDAPRLSIPLLSLHVCTCGELLKAYAKLAAPLAGLDAYDPEGRFRKAAVPGGIVVLRPRHGEPYTPCVASQTVFRGPGEAVTLVVDALWRAAYLGEPKKPTIPSAIAPTSLEGWPGVQRIDDPYERRPPVYLVNPNLAVEKFCGKPDYTAFEAWQAGVRTRIERLVAGLDPLPVAIDVRQVIRPPRRKPPDAALVAVDRSEAAPPCIVAEPPPPPEPLPRRPYAVQLSLFSAA